MSAALHLARRLAPATFQVLPHAPKALSALSVQNAQQRRASSSQPLYPGHVPLNWFENAFMLAGSSYMALTAPARHDMVAAVGDLTSGPVLPALRDQMLASPEGRRILKERPRINTKTVDMNKLAMLPEGTLGHTYITWLERCNVTPDTREPVHYVDDPELAYVLQRYRESHDFYHCIVNLPVDVTSELAVKFFEYANLGLPMAGFAAAFGPLRIGAAKRERLFREYVPWAVQCGAAARCLVTVYWERRWAQDVGELKRELGVWDAPEARWPKPRGEGKAL